MVAYLSYDSLSKLYAYLNYRPWLFYPRYVKKKDFELE